MPIPEDFILGPLQQATEKIANLEDLDHFEGYDYNLLLAGKRDMSDGIYPVVLTNVHIIPGEPEPRPRLHKARFVNGDVPPDISELLEGRFVEGIKAQGASLGNDGVRFIAQQILDACEEIEEPSSIIVPFQTVAVFGIYNTEHNQPFVHSFIAKPLVDALVGRLPEPTPPEDISEQMLKDMHAIEAEQAPATTETFPEWKAMIKDSLFTYSPKDPRHKRDMAKAAMAYTLLPRADTNSIINRILFSPPEQPEA
jgi:hypothetical protein